MTVSDRRAGERSSLRGSLHVEPVAVGALVSNAASEQSIKNSSTAAYTYDLAA